jgi:endonuclease G
MPAKQIPSWLGGDPPLLDELRRRLKTGGPGVASRMEVPIASLEHVLKALEAGDTVHAAAETAILAGFMRPCAAYGQNTESGVWRRRLALVDPELARAAQATARIAASVDSGMRWAGAGWLVADKVLVTTRATGEAGSAGSAVQFENGPEAEVARVLVDAESGLAFLQLTSKHPLPAWIPLGDDSPGPYVAVAGYPFADSRVQGTASLLGYSDPFDRFAVAPGHVRASGTKLRHDCGMPGNAAGAVVIDLNSGSAAGLHAGGFLEGTGTGAAAIREAMQRQGIELPEVESLESFDEDSLEAVKLTPKDYADRMGFDENFLGTPVPTPKPAGRFRNDALTYPGPKGKIGVLPYTHFSVVMSKSRKLCFYAAVNIDGKQAKELRRKDKADRWLVDPRIQKDSQSVRQIYRGGFLDLGHMVRRLDPVWGDDFRLANDDTFHFTNACPQHKDLNRKVWNDLEDYILANTSQEEMRVSVFTGPVLSEHDPPYRGIQLPQEYWKVAVMINPDTKKLHATAYILSQADMITGLEFAFGQFRTYQLPLAELEKKTQMDFGILKNFDPKRRKKGAAGLESVPYTEITSPDDLVI